MQIDLFEIVLSVLGTSVGSSEYNRLVSRIGQPTAQKEEPTGIGIDFDDFGIGISANQDKYWLVGISISNPAVSKGYVKPFPSYLLNGIEGTDTLESLQGKMGMPPTMVKKSGIFTTLQYNTKGLVMRYMFHPDEKLSHAIFLLEEFSPYTPRP